MFREELMSGGANPFARNEAGVGMEAKLRQCRVELLSRTPPLPVSNQVLMTMIQLMMMMMMMMMMTTEYLPRRVEFDCLHVLHWCGFGPSTGVDAPLGV